MNVDKCVRRLAKSSYYQSLYSQAKEVGLCLFRNKTDLTNYQISFLRYISFYNTIYTDIALNEVDESVLRHEVFEDAYMYWKNKNLGKAPQAPQQDNGKETGTPKKTTLFR